MVGAARFELATPCTPCRCATGLRYAPSRLFQDSIRHFAAQLTAAVVQRFFKVLRPPLMVSLSNHR